LPARKNRLILSIRLLQSPEIQSRLEEAGLETLEYDRRDGGYRIRLGADDLIKRGDVLRQLIDPTYRGRKEKP
jgi:hypothetical protein